MLTNILITFLMMVGSFIGGEQLAHYQDKNLPPKTVINDTRIKVDSKTTSEANANAYSITILKDGTMFKNLVISQKGGTNIQISVTSNRIVTTNK